MPKIEQTHDQYTQISNKFNQSDQDNEMLRTKMEYKPKMNITHSSSIRYKFNPKDS